MGLISAPILAAVLAAVLIQQHCSQVGFENIILNVIILGVPLSRRGDLQVLSYCAIEWAGATLPWASWEDCDKIRDEKVR